MAPSASRVSAQGNRPGLFPHLADRRRLGANPLSMRDLVREQEGHEPRHQSYANCAELGRSRAHGMPHLRALPPPLRHNPASVAIPGIAQNVVLSGLK